MGGSHLFYMKLSNLPIKTSLLYLDALQWGDTIFVTSLYILMHFCQIFTEAGKKAGQSSEFKLMSSSNNLYLSVWPWGISELLIMNHESYQVSYGIM